MKKNRLLLLVFMLLILLGVIFSVLGIISDINSKKLVYLNDLTTMNEKNTLKNAYLDVHTTPLIFAEYDDDDNKFYIVKDEEYLYIVYMDDNLYNKIINVEDIEEKPYRLEGHTNIISADIKNIAIEVYNEMFEEEIINDDNFESYFGSVYLDANNTYNVAIEWYISALIVLLIGGFGFYNYFYKSSKKNRKK